MLIDKTSIKKIPNWLELLRENGGVLLVDKEKDWTSFDVVAKLRNLLRIKKIGHAGTLDPLATGLLIVCVGRQYTKHIESFQAIQKEYIGTIKFGVTTKTEDAEAEEENHKDYDHLTSEMIYNSFFRFIGKYKQIPPKYSAKNINGQRAYVLARKNIEFDLKPNDVEIYSLNLQRVDLPFADFRVECSKGTYIRSLARDIGESIGTGAYLSKLRRTTIGSFSVRNALQINDVVKSIDEYDENISII